MLNVIGFQFLQWKTDVYNIPPIISVIQIGVVEVLLSFISVTYMQAYLQTKT